MVVMSWPVNEGEMADMVQLGLAGLGVIEPRWVALHRKNPLPTSQPPELSLCSDIQEVVRHSEQLDVTMVSYNERMPRGTLRTQ